MSKSDRVAEAARWFVLNCLRQRVRDNRLRGTKPRVIEKFPRILIHEQQWVLITDPVEKWGAPGGGGQGDAGFAKARGSNLKFVSNDNISIQ